MKSFKGRSFRRYISFASFAFLLVVLICSLATACFAADIIRVTTLSDDVSGSLRFAIESADEYEDVISFDVTGTIMLTKQLRIDHGLTIQGPGADLLAVSGGGEGGCRVFYIAAAESVDISGISIVSGDATASDYGGGIYNASNKLTVENVTFTGNSASAGGGMYNYSNSPTVIDCTFTGNSATHGGAGMYNEYAYPTVTSCTFFENNADYGAGMYNNTSSPTVTSCTFFENSASAGGGMYNEYAYPTVTSCTFFENSAQYGGGMYSYSSSLTVTSCTFTGNSATHCGGMYSYSSSLTVTSCTFTGNSSTHGGAGMYNNTSSPTVTNCIFWNDTWGEIHNDFSTTTLNYCVVQSDDHDGSTISEYVTSADPVLQDLADNGGPTWTCALGEGSSAIDAGTSDGAPNTDQRGVSRPQGSGYDIGAFEVEQASSSGGGCSISTFPTIGFLLLVPLMFLSGRR